VSGDGHLEYLNLRANYVRCTVRVSAGDITWDRTEILCCTSTASSGGRKGTTYFTRSAQLIEQHPVVLPPFVNVFSEFTSNPAVEPHEKHSRK